VVAVPLFLFDPLKKQRKLLFPVFFHDRFFSPEIEDQLQPASKNITAFFLLRDWAGKKIKLPN